MAVAIKCTYSENWPSCLVHDLPEGGILMRVRATYFVARGLAGLLSDNVEQAAAADDISRRNNLHVTRPNAPHHPDDSFSRMFPGLPPYTPQTDKAREQVKKLGVKGGILDTADNLTDPIKSITKPGTFSPNNPDNSK